MGEGTPNAPDGQPAAPAGPPPDARPMPRADVSREAERRARLKSRRRERRHRRWRITEAGAAFAAFLLSLGVFLLGGYQWVRGSEVVVLQPDTVLLYRDETANGSALWLAVQAPMINQASADYGDVVVRAYATIRGEGRGRDPQFQYRAVIQYVALGATRAQADRCGDDPDCIRSALMTAAEAQAAQCERGARCIANRGMYVVERPATLLDVPGGASRSELLAFELQGWNCEGDDTDCGRFTNFETGVSELRQQSRLLFEVTLEFHGDGRKVLQCEASSERPTEAVLDYLSDRGWASIQCG